MPRQPSEATQIKTLKRKLRESEKERWGWEKTAKAIQGRLKILTAELVEWKERFDILLRREEDK